MDYKPFGGEVPPEWKQGSLKDILRLKKNAIKAGTDLSSPYLPIDIIPMRSLGLAEFKPNSEAQSSLITFDKNDILIGAMRVYFHRVAISPCHGITRSTCFVLEPTFKEYLAYGLLTCDSDAAINYAQKTSKGSTMPYAVWEGGLGNYEICIPSKDDVQEFNNLVMPMIEKIRDSYLEITALTQLRDSLLPKLMSGELDVSEIEL